jgi:hypothetical protein
MESRAKSPAQLRPRMARDNGVTCAAKEVTLMQRMDYLEFTSMMESFGITDRRFIAPLYSQLIDADGFGGDGLEFAASVIKGGKPNDQLEVMHFAQMAVMHWAAMKYMRQVGDERGTQFQELIVATATKLVRAYTGGEQKIRVQHVSVSDGGQAIVANVIQNALEASADY